MNDVHSNPPGDSPSEPRASEAPELGDLPELNRAVLDWATAEQLFHDVASLTQVLEVIAKAGLRTNASDKPLDMAQGLELLKMRQALGVQLRYLHEGVQWWDTLMWRGEELHLIRIRHDFGDRQTPGPAAPA